MTTVSLGRIGAPPRYKRACMIAATSPVPAGGSRNNWRKSMRAAPSRSQPARHSSAVCIRYFTAPSATFSANPAARSIATHRGDGRAACSNTISAASPIAHHGA
eukprot:scaffold122037_cov31-Tisochrysis_lutea.AAC.2